MRHADAFSVTDDTLIRTLSGFTHAYATVNKVKLHYVQGGTGAPLVLLPGWPETWWAYHHIMPRLAERFTVIAVDLRGMGSSDKPTDGYEKKNMALDVANLIEQLGYERAAVAGHDIGALVAYSLAANHPDRVSKLVLLDTPHPDQSMYKLPMLPMAPLDTPGYTYPWWVAFNQVPGLPEQVLVGQMGRVLDWVFDALLLDPAAISEHDRAVYRAAYDSEAGIRGGCGWYRAFPQDIADAATYARIDVPTLGLAGAGSHDMMAQALKQQATDFRMEKVNDSGHFLLAEQPEQALEAMLDFLN
ncbi:pimeloyl-ACP methyl ester carboxylesterase [Neolewinella xylanilytica]|uniref:Pimeloyl-ACP methyl ester carboxylesterase n=1 Tax=Neolewinella xylanilytica TaxID=1514080 RepID=A0A2S6I7A3_9BACT|nr:alpha/beta hydrolase [Neolewinella xylanilytica]PPK87391.1 pimeloyl-ACP methyl ester carboxylesterase [Neolewinella xylanilytica]